MNQLKMQNGQLLTRLDNLETYSRAEHLVVYGLPELTLAEISSNSNSSFESSDANCGAVVALQRSTRNPARQPGHLRGTSNSSREEMQNSPNRRMLCGTTDPRSGLSSPHSFVRT